ncbi:MAG: type IV toxin-antitoxin system AbiEi family antitoxin domain-containing protein [Alkalispirochaeta sp.]
MQRLTEILVTTHPRDCITAEDLAHYMPGSDDARYGLVKRAIAAGELVRLRRGLYCLAPAYRRAPLNLFALAQYIYGPSYISLESALSHHDWIPEGVYSVTSVCTGESKMFQTPVATFRYSRVPQNIFYAAVARETASDAGDAMLIARPVKALADYVYVNRKDWGTPGPALQSLRIDPEDLAGISADDMNETMESYRSKRVLRFLSGLRKEYGV